MQPYFFPYPGYFSLIKAVDKFIIFDIPQFEKYSWMSRNRILKQDKSGWLYFVVPVNKHHLKTPLNQIEICNKLNWKEKITAQMGYYKKHAPYYREVVDFLKKTLEPEFTNLSKLNIHSLRATTSYIGIEFNYEVFSEMDLDVEKVNAPDEWGVNICRAMGVTDFINPEGGQQFMDKKKYSDKGVNLRFLEFEYPPYDQRNNSFIPGLSILDAMMFNSPAEIRQMLDKYHLTS